MAGAYYLLVSRAQGGVAIRYSDEDLKVFEATKKIGRTVSGFAALGLLAVAIVCFGTADAGHAYHAVLGTNLVIAAASAAIGAVIGFIFGIPRVLDAASRVAVANAVGRQTDGKAVFAVNTNLEKVSDWLTTLLIGATLVQVGSIPGWLGGLSTFIEPAVGVANSRVAPFVVVFYFGLAFLGVYLITRLYLTTALNLPGIDGDNGIGALSETEAEAVVEAGSGAAPAAAAAGDDAAALTALVSKAGASGDPAAIEGALAKVEAVQGSARTDPGLNGALARLLAKSIADGSPAADRRDALQAAVQRAALDPTVRASLKADLDAGRLTTGDTAADAEIGALLAG